MKPNSPSDLPLVARFAGAFLLASAFFSLGATVSFGTWGHKTPAGYGFSGVGLVSLALWLWGRWRADQGRERVKADRFSRGRTLLGVNAVASVLLLGVVLVGANYFAARHHKTFDLTRNRINSLSDQTEKALQKLPSPVRLSYFYAARQVDPTAQSLLDAYARASGKVKVETVSALREPSRVPSGFTGAPLLVAQFDAAPDKKSFSAASKQEISVVDEQNLTSALLKLISPKAQRLYFLSGHGEAAPAQLPEFEVALRSQNYELQLVSLLGKGAKVPSDAAALLVVAPRVDLSAAEAPVLRQYLGSGGRLLLLLSPARAPLPRWNEFLAWLGLRAGPGYVVDTQLAYQSAQLPVGLRGDITRHPILRGVSADVVFPGAVPLAASGAGVTPLFSSSPAAQILQTDGKTGARGPFVLAAAIERGPGRAVVSSSATLATGQGLPLFGNRSFLLASLGWVAGNDALVSIPPKPPLAGTLEMNDATLRFATLFSVLVMPLVALGIGGAVWWKRR